MKDRKFGILFLILSIIVVFLAVNYNFISNTFLGIYLLISNLLVLINCRNDKNIFVIFFAIMYFNYSYAITKYIGTPSSILSEIYVNIRIDSSMTLAICAQILFFAVMNWVIGKKIKFNDHMLNEIITFPYRKILVVVLDIVLVAILYYHLSNNIVDSTTLLEYSIILFIFALYLSKDYKFEKLVVEVILLAFALYSLRNGDRIAILQLLLSDFLINYVNKFTKKQIVLCVFAGIFSFTLFGIYGDLYDSGGDLNSISINNTFNTLMDRRFAIDTSVAAYHSGLTMVESRRYYTLSSRVNNGITYLTTYTLLGGSISGYIPLNNEVAKYRPNIGGGYLTSYFFFWFGWVGVILIALYIGRLLILINNNENKSLYKDLLAIFILSTFPRWYLYAPDMLFRGIILFSLVYVGISFIFIRNKKILKKDKKSR